METKSLKMDVDKTNGVSYIYIKNNGVNKTISLSDEGCPYLDGLAVDIVLDFDEEGKLVGLELLGFDI